MKRKHLLGVAIPMAGLVLALFGGPSSSGGTQAGPGLSYGGITPSNISNSLFLAPGRRAIRSLEVWWEVSAKRCSSGNPYGDSVFAGSVWGHPISVSEAGSFKATIRDDDLNTARYVISGKVSGHVVQGTLRGRVRIDKDDGSVVRCRIGPQTWGLVD